jgi:hypothetical protein
MEYEFKKGKEDISMIEYLKWVRLYVTIRYYLGISRKIPFNSGEHWITVNLSPALKEKNSREFWSGCV